jgi:GNAT superfamily N-acetyltransferase
MFPCVSLVAPNPANGTQLSGVLDCSRFVSLVAQCMAELMGNGERQQVPERDPPLFEQRPAPIGTMIEQRFFQKGLPLRDHMQVDAMDVRAAEEAEIDHLAKVWFDGWQDGHAQIVPAELTRLRTLESFRHRLHEALPNIRVVGPPGSPVGFCIVKGDELYQLFVSAPSRGSGVARALIADAEARLSENGVGTAWLACAIGNERAARFYEKCGWHRVGTMVNQVETSNELFPLEVWRYEKSLARQA